MAAEQLISADVEFWPLDTVRQKVGLSRSEIYRQISLDQVPASRSYRNCAGRKFWLSTDVRRWQAEQLGAPVDDAAGLIG